MRRAALLLALLALAAPSAAVSGSPRRSAQASPSAEHAGHAHAAVATPAVDPPDLAAVGVAAGGGAVGEMAIEKAEEKVVEAAVRKQELYDEATAREERNRAATGALFVGGAGLQGMERGRLGETRRGASAVWGTRFAVQAGCAAHALRHAPLRNGSRARRHSATPRGPRTRPSSTRNHPKRGSPPVCPRADAIHGCAPPAQRWWAAARSTA
jgi:hypothetical protein